MPEPVAAALQQLLAQPLPLQKLQLDINCDLPVTDMSQLTQLTELDALFCKLPAKSELPAQLQLLKFKMSDLPDSLVPVTQPQLKQLQHLHLKITHAQPQQLLQLARLPVLQHLELSYEDEADISATASTWKLLPQLRGLGILPIGSLGQDNAAILAGLSAATSLTTLQLLVVNKLAGASGVAVCASLTRLTRLKDLCITCWLNDHGDSLAAGDAQALTALSSLTWLGLGGAGAGVGTAAATALANSLKQLQGLDLSGCGLQLDTADGMACLQAIGSRLTQLTCLSLLNNPGLTRYGLMQLTGLSRLQELDVDRDGAEVTDEVLQVFWAALRRQQLMTWPLDTLQCMAPVVITFGQFQCIADCPVMQAAPYQQQQQQQSCQEAQYQKQQQQQQQAWQKAADYFQQQGGQQGQQLVLQLQQQWQQQLRRDHAR
jgi:hypothetical protein